MSWTPATLLSVIGLVLLALTPFVGSGVLEMLLAFGLACLSTAGLLQLDVLSGNWPTILVIIAAQTLLFAVLIWRPLRRLMNNGDDGNAQVSDWVGLQLTLPDDFDSQRNPYLQYSGVRWHVQAADPSVVLAAGFAVQVVRAQVGNFWVQLL